MIDENRPVAEDEVPKEQDGFLTKEMFAAQFHQLAERAKAAGLHPIQTMTKTYVKQVAAIFESLLDALENEDTTKKKKN